LIANKNNYKIGFFAKRETVMGYYKQTDDTPHMTTRLLKILTILLPTISFGQSINDSLLSTFYNKTISLYFADSSINNHHPEFENILLQTDFDKARLIKYLDKNKFTYFDSNTDKHSILEKPFKKNNGRNIYWVITKYNIMTRLTLILVVGH